MRRKDREILDPNQIALIIKQCQVCRLAMCKNNQPYMIPISFGFDGSVIYFHTALDGQKIEYIKSNNSVCFEFDCNTHLVSNDIHPCKWLFTYQSVIGFGKISELTIESEMIYALKQIMLNYSGSEWEFSNDMMKNIRVWKIDIDEMSGKQSL
jgi:nitroimidazol reductase NimA-like FMN-containing flavoprotein (pyridoxamine 5'-phosphate oxidase superfamily)